MNPREFADALASGKKFIDSETGKVVSIYGGVDIQGDCIGVTDNGETIKVNAKKLEISKEPDKKTDSEKLDELIAQLTVGKEEDIETSEPKKSELLNALIENLNNEHIHLYASVVPLVELFPEGIPVDQLTDIGKKRYEESIEIIKNEKITHHNIENAIKNNITLLDFNKAMTDVINAAREEEHEQNKDDEVKTQADE